MNNLYKAYKSKKSELIRLERRMTRNESASFFRALYDLRSDVRRMESEYPSICY
jgi:hypothetical protein